MDHPLYGRQLRKQLFHLRFAVVQLAVIAVAIGRQQDSRLDLAQPARPAASAASAAAAPQAGASAPAPDDQSCAAQWQRYNAAYACMDGYRLKGGGVRPEAFDKCPVVAQPCCPPP